MTKERGALQCGEVSSLRLSLILAAVALALVNPTVEARDATGPRSPTLRFEMVKQWLAKGMRLEVGEVYSGKRYPKDVALSVAGIMIVVPYEYVVQIE